MKAITKTIFILSLVSMFTDISTEMLYPVMPIFLKSIGYSVVFIGVLEGIAEAVAGYGKGYFGRLSDTMGKRVPFVKLGYGLSAFSKPVMVFFLNPIWILFSRALDRTGKGIRTGARDALLSAETTKEHKGRVFGFHRAFDTIGAAIGPILALIYLGFFPGQYIYLFYLAAVPAVIGFGFTFFLKEPKTETENKFADWNILSFLKYWKTSSIEYKKLVVGLLAFALVNSSDVFLLLLVKQRGFSDSTVIAVYIFYNLIYALFSYPIGIFADKLGMKLTFILGLSAFVVTYGLLPYANSNVFLYSMFIFYGFYAAATEGISKAWISNITEKNNVATAIGFYTSWQSLMAFLASATAGLMWHSWSYKAPFIVTSAGVILIIFYFSILLKNNVIYKKK